VLSGLAMFGAIIGLGILIAVYIVNHIVNSHENVTTTTSGDLSKIKSVGYKFKITAVLSLLIACFFALFQPNNDGFIDTVYVFLFLFLALSQILLQYHIKNGIITIAFYVTVVGLIVNTMLGIYLLIDSLSEDTSLGIFDILWPVFFIFQYLQYYNI